MQTIQARWYHEGRISPIRVIVVHSAETAERSDVAEAVARYFATTSVKASAHVCVDNDSAVRCVADSDTAWGAPGANADGLQIELAGTAAQTREQWLDTYSRAVLARAAEVVADWCRRYQIPARKLTRAELKAGHKGITSHADVSAVYKLSDHTDPGEGFPWDVFIGMVTARLGVEAPPADAPMKAPPWPGRLIRLTRPYMAGTDVQMWQRRMRARGWSLVVDGIYGPRSTEVCRLFQREKGLLVDGIVGPETWRAAWEAPIT